MSRGGEVAFLIVDGAAYRCELLKTLHLPEAKHGALPSSEGQVAVLGSVIEPPPCNALFRLRLFLQRGALGSQAVSHN